jgi:hypothetical protein
MFPLECLLPAFFQGRLQRLELLVKVCMAWLVGIFEKRGGRRREGGREGGRERGR